MNMGRKILISNVVLMNIGSIGTRIFQFIFILIISRYFGIEVFGYYGTANTSAIIFITLFGFGSGFYLTREIAYDKGQTEHIFNNILKIRIILIVIVAFIYLPFINFLPYPDELKNILVIFFFVAAFRGFIQQNGFLFQAHEYFRYQVLFDFFIYLGLIVIAFVVKKYGFNINYFSCILLLYYLTWYVIEWRFIQNKILRFKLWPFNLRELKNIYIKALPFFFSSIIGIIYHRIDIFMLGFFKNQSEVGLYVAPYNLYEAFLFIPVAFGNVIFPKLVPLLRRRHFKFVNSNIGVLMYVLLIVMIPILVGLIVFSDDIILLIFGKEYEGSSIVLKIIPIGLIFHSFNNILGRMLYAVNQEKYQVKISILAMLCNVVLNLFLIPKYSIVGASISTILSFLISFLLHYFRAKNKIAFKRIFSLTQVSKLILLIGLLLFLSVGIQLKIESHILIKLLIFGLLYVCVIIVMEKRTIKGLIMNYKGI